MAAVIASELNSLEEIRYKSRVQSFLIGLACVFLFVVAFLNFFPIGDKIKGQLKTHLQGTGCVPEFDTLHFEWFMPKVVITDVSLPAQCMGRMGDPIKLSHMTLNFNLISFSPFGIPFKLETEMAGQPLALYYVVGFGEQLIRMKDQTINLARLEPFTGPNFKVAGKVTVDMNLAMNNNSLKGLNLKVASRDLQLPPQSVQGFNVPNLRFNEFYLEANSVNQSRINVDRFVIGNPESPIRANFKGRIDLQEGAAMFSPLDLAGEVAFSQELKETLPLIDMMFQSFTQRDGFYQVRIGGTLGAPKPIAP